MLLFEIDPDHPCAALEDCAGQIDMFVDFISESGGSDFTISDSAAAAFCNNLRAVSQTIQQVQNLVCRQLSDAALVAACRQAGQFQGSGVDDPQMTHPNEPTAETPPQAPRLTKSRRADGGRRAAA